MIQIPLGSVLPFARFADEGGYGVGNANAIGNYGTPYSFRVKAETGTTVVVKNIRVLIVGSATADANLYGNITALTNGIYIRKYTGSKLICDLTGGKPVKSNDDWAKIGDSRCSEYTAGENYVSVLIPVAMPGYQGLVLTPDDELNFVLNDNLSTLLKHTFFVTGTVQ